VDYVDIMKLYGTLESGELVDLVRFMWASPVLDRATRLGCTLGALGRLADGQKKALCLALMQLHAPDIWVSSELARYLDSYEGVVTSELVNTDELHLGLWRVPGNDCECRLCGYKPPGSTGLLKMMPRWLKKYYLKIWNNCGACNTNALDQCPLSIRDLCELDVTIAQL
jgi:hypothetical protein